MMAVVFLHAKLASVVITRTTHTHTTHTHHAHTHTHTTHTNTHSEWWVSIEKHFFK
jgi:hypothetical protein